MSLAQAQPRRSAPRDFTDTLIELLPVTYKQRDSLAEVIDGCGCTPMGSCPPCLKLAALVAKLEAKLETKYPGHQPRPVRRPVQLDTLLTAATCSSPVVQATVQTVQHRPGPSIMEAST